MKTEELLKTVMHEKKLEEIFTMVENLEKLDDMRKLTKLLAPGKP